MTYMVNGKQYIIVAVSGGNYSGEYIAFACRRPRRGRRVSRDDRIGNRVRVIDWALSGETSSIVNAVLDYRISLPMTRERARATGPFFCAFDAHVDRPARRCPTRAASGNQPRVRAKA